MNDPLFAAKKERRMKALEVIWWLLVLEDFDKWMEAAPALARRMSEAELKTLALACLRALPVEEAVDAAEAALGPDLCPPPIQIEDAVSAARMGLLGAGQPMVRAYAMVCVEMMPPRTRYRFLKWMKEKLGER